MSLTRDITDETVVAKKPGAAVVAVQEGKVALIPAASLIEGLSYNSLADKPDLGDLSQIDLPGGTSLFLREDGTWAVPPGGGGGGVVIQAAWGGITGNLAQQTDLVNLLNAKASTQALADLSQTVSGKASTQDLAATNQALAAKAPINNPVFTGAPRAPTPATNTTQGDSVATADFVRAVVAAAGGGGGGGGATAWGAITGDILSQTDLQTALNSRATTTQLSNLSQTVDTKAPLASPVFTGNPQGPTQLAGTNNKSLATTEFVKTAIGTALSNPMTSVGDMIIGGANGSPTRVAAGQANYGWISNGPNLAPSWKPIAGSTASNASNVFFDAIKGPARTAQSKMQDYPTVYDFGAIGTNRNLNTPLSTRYGTLADARTVYPRARALSDQIDGAALQAMCTWMDAQQRSVSLAGAKLNCDTYVLMGRAYCRIYGGGGAEIGGQYQTKKRIDGDTNPPAADLSYPSDTSAGPLDGSVFYFPNTIYYAYIEGIQFNDLRFCIAHNQDPNSPTYENCFFGYSNVGIIHYQGTQTPCMINCGGGVLGVAHISSATCFPAGSPWSGSDNYYTDGFKMLNAVAGGFDSFGIAVYANFDTWFINSILRPNTDSVTTVGTNKYVDRSGNLYTDNYTDPDGKVWPQGYFLNPTGRVVFIPYRTLRLCFTFTMIGADTRGTVKYGYALVNTEINALKIEDVNYEGMYNYDNINDDRPVIGTFGAVRTGTVSRQGQISYIDQDHPLFAYTGRGRNDGATDGTSLHHSGTVPITKKLTRRVGETYDLGGIRDFFAYRSTKLPNPENYQDRQQVRTDANAPKEFLMDLRDGATLTNNDTEMILRTVPRIIDLPDVDETTGVLRANGVMNFIYHHVGYMHLDVVNKTTGARDYAIYSVSTDQAETLELAAPLQNGMTEVTFTTQPAQGGIQPRFSYYFPVQADGTTPVTGANAGKGFTTDAYIGGNKCRLNHRMSGVTGNFPTGTKFRRVQRLDVVKPFANTPMVTPLIGSALPFQSSNNIGLRVGAGASTEAAAAMLDSVRISVVFSHFASITM